MGLFDQKSSPVPQRRPGFRKVLLPCVMMPQTPAACWCLREEVEVLGIQPAKELDSLHCLTRTGQRICRVLATVLREVVPRAFQESAEIVGGSGESGCQLSLQREEGIEGDGNRRYLWRCY